MDTLSAVISAVVIIGMLLVNWLLRLPPDVLLRLFG